MDRYWFLSWTTYGTWLPGDKRGFVSPVRDGDGPQKKHNGIGSEIDSDMPGLVRSAMKLMRGPPVYLLREQAPVLLTQFQETATYRGWQLLAVAIMRNHVHLVVGVPGDPDSAGILNSFKSYGSRALNRKYKQPISGTWWTESGSQIHLKQPENVQGVVQYIREQDYPLLVWSVDLEASAEQPSAGERGA